MSLITKIINYRRVVASASRHPAVGRFVERHRKRSPAPRRLDRPTGQIESARHNVRGSPKKLRIIAVVSSIFSIGCNQLPSSTLLQSPGVAVRIIIPMRVTFAAIECPFLWRNAARVFGPDPERACPTQSNPPHRSHRRRLHPIDEDDAMTLTRSSRRIGRRPTVEFILKIAPIALDESPAPRRSWKTKLGWAHLPADAFARP
jgi:hypothetical protein